MGISYSLFEVTCLWAQIVSTVTVISHNYGWRRSHSYPLMLWVQGLDMHTGPAIVLGLSVTLLLYTPPRIKVVYTHIGLDPTSRLFLHGGLKELPRLSSLSQLRRCINTWFSMGESLRGCENFGRTRSKAFSTSLTVKSVPLLLT